MHAGLYVILLSCYALIFNYNRFPVLISDATLTLPPAPNEPPSMPMHTQESRGIKWSMQ